MKDKCGQEIARGDVVDVLVDGMMCAIVADIQEGGIVDLNTQRPAPAKLILQIAVPIVLNPGQPAPVYVIMKPPKKESGLDVIHAHRESV